MAQRKQGIAALSLRILLPKSISHTMMCNQLCLCKFCVLAPLRGRKAVIHLIEHKKTS